MATVERDNTSLELNFTKETFLVETKAKLKCTEINSNNYSYISHEELFSSDLEEWFKSPFKISSIAI